MHSAFREIIIYFETHAMFHLAVHFHIRPSYCPPAPSPLGRSVVEEVIHPCNPNPCPSNHLCQVNRKGCLDELNCQPYLCVPGTTIYYKSSQIHCVCPAVLKLQYGSPSVCMFVCSGCKLGEASEFLVQQDARIQVPTRTGPAGCYEVCSCGPSGRLENCVEMPCVDTNKPCIVEGQRKSKASTITTSLKDRVLQKF